MQNGPEQPDGHRSVATDPPDSGTGMHRVVGFFRSRDKVRKAVNTLTRRSVPTDTITVHLLDDEGNRARELPVHSESGTLKGALIGAGIGAIVGVLIVGLVPTGAFGPDSMDVFGVDTVIGAIRTIAVAAVAGVPLGALIGMGHWQGAKKVDEADVANTGATVTVESDAMADRAREVFEEVGAERVTG